MALRMLVNIRMGIKQKKWIVLKENVRTKRKDTEH